MLPRALRLTGITTRGQRQLRWPHIRNNTQPIKVVVKANLSTNADKPDIDVDNVAYGFMASQALFTALETGIFDAIHKAKDKKLNLKGLQDACKLDKPRFQTLLTSLVAINSLYIDHTGAYSNSPNTEAYLVSSSKYFYGDYLQYQMGRQFYHRMGALPEVMASGKAPSYASWFSDKKVADTYTRAQHNGSVATAKSLVKRMPLEGVKKMLDVGGGSGAFSYVFTNAHPELTSLILELPEVCATGNKIRMEQSQSVQDRTSFVELDATSPSWPVNDAEYDVVLMSYISGSVPETLISSLYKNAYSALKPGGRLLIHDFMVNDTLDGPPLGALWALQHVTVNADGLGLCPKEVISRMGQAGFDESLCETREMIKGLTKCIVAHKK